MKYILSVAIILSFTLSGCGPENTEDSPDVYFAALKEKEKKEAIHEYSDSVPQGVMEKDVALQFKDSGAYVNKLRDGYWVAYIIDSSLDGGYVEGVPSVKGHRMNLACIVYKEEGNYKAGKGTGVWKRFITSDNRFPFRWVLTHETTYKNGLKDGTAIYYDYGDTLTVSTYKKGKLLNKKIIHEENLLKSKIWESIDNKK